MPAGGPAGGRGGPGGPSGHGQGSSGGGDRGGYGGSGRGSIGARGTTAVGSGTAASRGGVGAATGSYGGRGEPDKGILSYGIEGLLKGLTTGSLSAGIMGGLVGLAVGSYKSYSEKDAYSLSTSGVGMVKDTTTGAYHKASDMGIQGEGMHTVSSDESGKISKVHGSIPQNEITAQNNTFNTGSAAANTQASYEQQGLDYLIERDKLPKQFSEGALKGLGGVYGLEGGTGSQQDLIDRAIASPLYGAIMGGQEAGEEAILRNVSATGHLRSGNVKAALYDEGVQLQNKALLESYNQQLQGLTGMANLPSMAQPIASQTSQIGQTVGQGMVASQQMEEAESQQNINNLMGLGKIGLQAYEMFSDRKLKKNIKWLGHIKGVPWFSFTWNKIAEELGLTGECQGTMAEEAYELVPESVTMRDGFMFVDYSMLNIFPEKEAV